jgi:hypothetical protein
MGLSGKHLEKQEHDALHCARLLSLKVVRVC